VQHLACAHGFSEHEFAVLWVKVSHRHPIISSAPAPKLVSPGNISMAPEGDTNGAFKPSASWPFMAAWVCRTLLSPAERHTRVTASAGYPVLSSPCVKDSNLAA
jgi:hypothetical protein